MKKILKTAGKALGWFLVLICFVFCLFLFEMECDTDAEKWMITVGEILVKSGVYFMIADSLSHQFNRKLCVMWWVIPAVVGIEVLPLYLDRIMITVIQGIASRPGMMTMIHRSFLDSLLSLEYLLRVVLWSLFGVFAYFWGEKTVRYFGRKLNILDVNEVVSVSNKFIYFPQGTLSDGPVSIVKDQGDHIIVTPLSEEEVGEASYYVEQGKIRMDKVLFELLDCEEYFLTKKDGNYVLSWEELYVAEKN